MNTTLTLFCKKLPTSVTRCRMIKQTIVKRHLFCAISHGFDKLMKYGKDVINDKEVNTIPNIITFSRIAASPALAVAIAYDMKTPALIGCLLFGFSDWLDGYLARTLNQRTVLGAFLDPLADKVMIAAVSAGLACNGLIPLPLLAAIIGRDAVLLACSFVMRGLEKPKDAPFFDTTYSATFEIIPSDLSKVNTAVQFVLLSTTLSQFICGVPSLTMIEPIWYITATTTIYSGLGYLDGSGLRRLSKAGVGQGEKMAKIKQLFRNRINQEKE